MEHRKIKVLVFGVLVAATVVSAVWAVAFLRSDEFREIKEAQEEQELNNGRHTPVPTEFLWPSPSATSAPTERRTESPTPMPTPTVTATPSPSAEPTPFPKGDIPFPSPTARQRSPDRRSA